MDDELPTRSNVMVIHFPGFLSALVSPLSNLAQALNAVVRYWRGGS